MGRGRSGGGARPAARPAAKPAARPTATATRPAARSNAPATSASSRSAPAAAKPTQQTPAAQQAPQQQAPVSGGGGPGFLGTMFATAAGSAAGHVVGRSVMNAWEGSGSSERPEDGTTVPEGPQSNYLNAGPDDVMYNDRPTYNDDPQVCPMEKNTLINCLNNSSDCQWAMDMLNKCKQVAAQNSPY